MFSSVSGIHHRGGDPYETGSDTPIPNFIFIFTCSENLNFKDSLPFILFYYTITTPILNDFKYFFNI